MKRTKIRFELPIGDEYERKVDLAIRTARALLEKDHPRLGRYAYDVLEGRRRWSGADLAGEARKWSSYGRARGLAKWALFEAGGCIARGRNGMLMTGACIGTDDYGDRLIELVDGTIVRPPPGRSLARVLADRMVDALLAKV